MDGSKWKGLKILYDTHRSRVIECFSVACDFCDLYCVHCEYSVCLRGVCRHQCHSGWTSLVRSWLHPAVCFVYTVITQISQVASCAECRCGMVQTMSHIVNECPRTRHSNGGLQRLHFADDVSVDWLEGTTMRAFAKWKNRCDTDAL